VAYFTDIGKPELMQKENQINIKKSDKSWYIRLKKEKKTELASKFTVVEQTLVILLF